MIFRRNVLIFHTGALGDFVLTWPMAMALARIYPQSRVIYVTHQQKGVLAQKALGVESTDIELGWHALYGQTATLPREATRLLTGAHSIYTFLAGQNFESLDQQVHIYRMHAALDGEFSCHASEFLVGQLNGQPAVRSASEQMLHSIAQRGLGRHPIPGGDVLVHPGSGSRTKCWPADRFARLAERLVQAGVNVRFVLGEVELERFEKGQIAQLESVAPVLRPQTYLELFDLISRARLVIANDSGPGHLAGIAGMATLSLFGPTDVVRWKPLGPRVKTLRANTLVDLDVDSVYEAAGSMLG